MSGRNDYRSSLGNYAASMRDPDPAMARKAAREAYDASGGAIVLINREWLTNWPDQKQLDLLACKAFGISKGKV
ncbi:hypothetical protein GRI39_02035 [Altererythrobacter indicus]|uniref:Uncharacterized protein n=1 Tax=Altericroceibacterium indicum TaxID=374177 RepID=A0A845A8D7_9SPHN|nr:hypothetical protein [Altericroceibacterium indicum]MXP24826.1 hypothetical protein [Altericroceibacterium indicum]